MLLALSGLSVSWRLHNKHTTLPTNDTVGAMVGAAVGALHGRAALPSRWLRDMSGRLGAADDDRIGEVLRQARRKFAR